MTQMGFYFDQTRCTGCHTCAVACKDWHDVDAGPVNWMRVRTIEEGKFPEPFVAYLAAACYHCADPSCVKACPVDAISKRMADGIVVIDQEKCIGKEKCNSKCLKACPYDMPQFEDGPGAKMQKCDFCLDRIERGQQTICVEACPMYALDAGPLEQLRETYGNNLTASGFRHFKKVDPSVTFKPKLKIED